METIVIGQNEGGILSVCLNRPEKRNALNPTMLVELKDAFEQINQDDSIKAVIVEGTGKAFCAGADLEHLQQISTNTTVENFSDSLLLENVFYTIYTSPKVTIAKVHGPAIAGGCGLVSVCDFAVASREHAIFGYTEVRIGFIPAIVGVYLARKIGEGTARHLLLSSDIIKAEQALHIHLISHVVDHEYLDSFTVELATTLANNSGSSIALTKQLLSHIHGMDLRGALQYAAALNVIARGTDDCRRRIEDFLHQTKDKK